MPLHNGSTLPYQGDVVVKYEEIVAAKDSIQKILKFMPEVHALNYILRVLHRVQCDPCIFLHSESLIP